MNKRKGFLRLTLVLSVLIGISHLGISEDIFPSIGWKAPIFVFIIGFASVWLLYAFIRWIIIGFIVRGFKSK